MRRVGIGLFLALLFTGFSSAAHAVTAQPSETIVEKASSPFIITNYSFTASRLNFVQVFNNSDDVQSLDGWLLSYQITYGVTSQTVELPVVLSGWVLPSRYVVVADEQLGFVSPFEYTTSEPLSDDPFTVTSVDLKLPAAQPYLSSVATTPSSTPSNLCGADTAATTRSLRRNVSTSTGNYLSTFCYYDATSDTVLYMDPLYEYPTAAQLQIAEMVPNSRHCSPLDTAMDCQDYVKFYNPTDTDIDLSLFRLRNGYLGQTASSSNTTALQGIVHSGHYLTVHTNITNSAGWLWLEDAFGLHRYDDTVTEYPDGSATSKRGQAWAYDESDGAWKWTRQPVPQDSPSVFPSVVQKPAPVVVSTLKPCRSDQYRSSETNRCRNIVTATGQLTPCKAGQYRNPETNRCRSLATTVAASLAPCKPNQERNPDTNRCRNVIKTIPDAAFAVESIKQTGKAFVGWWALGGIGILAAGYGVWEWRRELLVAIQKTGYFFKSKQ